MITFMNLTSSGSILLSPKGKSIYTKNFYSGKCPCPKSPVENCYPSWMPNFLDYTNITDKFNFCTLNFDGQDYILPLDSAFDSSLTSRWYDPSDVNPDYCDDFESENYNADWKSILSPDKD